MQVVTSAETTVFVVDDDPAIRDSLKVFLESYGLTVWEFASCLEFLSHHDVHANGCLVLDVHMPVVGGLDLLQQLSMRNISIPAVLITGRPDHALRSRAREAGAFELLEKPFDGTTLLEAIHRAMDGSRRPTA